jgi:hypothetical protein
MAKKEVKTDLWVASQLQECKIPFSAQGSDLLNGILRVVINRQNRIEKGASKLYYMDSTEW